MAKIIHELGNRVIEMDKERVMDEMWCRGLEWGNWRVEGVSEDEYREWCTRRDEEKIGLPSILFHDLRHTAATLMLQQGTHPRIVQERLGHASIQLTMDTYSHVLPDMQNEIANRKDDLLTPTTFPLIPKSEWVSNCCQIFRRLPK